MVQRKLTIMSVHHHNSQALAAIIVVLLLSFLGLHTSQADQMADDLSLLELSDSIADLSATASQATVFIDGLRDEGEGRGTGSGFEGSSKRIWCGFR